MNCRSGSPPGFLKFAGCAEPIWGMNTEKKSADTVFETVQRMTAAG